MLQDKFRPLPYQPSFEHPEPHEGQVEQKLRETMLGISKQVHADSRHAERGAHAKSHGIVHGTLTVAADLPAELRQGVFAKPGSYPVVLRVSTAPGDLLPDSVSTIRGMAMKIIGVEGERLPGSEADRTLDFLMVNGPTFQNKNAANFLRDVKPFAAMTDKATGLKKLFAFFMRGIERLLEALGGKGNKIRLMGGQLPTHPLGESYFTQVPHLYGEYFGKYSLAPVSSSLKALKDQTIDIKAGDNPLRQAVSSYFTGQGGEWDFCVQLATDIDAMPIEDAAKDWSQVESPYRPIARVKVEPQQSWIAGVTEQLNERLSFSPWHGIAAHRPLGSIMRIRKSVYELVSGFRRDRNAVPKREPQSIEELFGRRTEGQLTG